jgi:hypothetical protein
VKCDSLFEAVVYLNGEKLGTDTGVSLRLAFEVTGKVETDGQLRRSQSE